MKIAILPVALAASVVSFNLAIAADSAALPENARPLTANETVEIYRDKTLDFGVAKYFFGMDGNLTGYSDSPKSVASGTWSVNENKFCMNAVWRGAKSAKPVIYNSCGQWFSDGSSYWIKITENSSPALVGRVYKGDEKAAASGDEVSKHLEKVKLRLGYN